MVYREPEDCCGCSLKVKVSGEVFFFLPANVVKLRTAKQVVVLPKQLLICKLHVLFGKVMSIQELLAIDLSS